MCGKIFVLLWLQFLTHWVVPVKVSWMLPKINSINVAVNNCFWTRFEPNTTVTGYSRKNKELQNKLFLQKNWKIHLQTEEYLLSLFWEANALVWQRGPTHKVFGDGTCFPPVLSEEYIISQLQRAVSHDTWHLGLWYYGPDVWRVMGASTLQL